MSLRTFLRKPRLRVGLLGIAEVWLLSVSLTEANAQTFSNLHTFAKGGFFNASRYTNSDGASPNGGLIAAGSVLYGTCNTGGSGGSGNIFSVTNDGTGFRLIYTFSADVTNNTDGSQPAAGLLLVGSRLYGTTSLGGAADQGVIFAVNTNGTSFSNLHSFTAVDPTTFVNSDGANPFASLILGGARLYGTAYAGGSAANGTIFAVNTNGTGFANLHSFSALDTNTGTNTDGANPSAELLLAGARLYGTASGGGFAAQGVLFAIITNGTGFTVLHHFNGDGSFPSGGLVLAGATLYGISGNDVYAINTNGTGFHTVLHFTNNVGSAGGLSVFGSTLFGAAPSEGAFGNGVVFAVNTNGTSSIDFHDFSTRNFLTNADGAFPNGDLVWANGTLYGTVSAGGAWGNGILYSARQPVVLSALVSGKTFTVSFPTISGASYSILQNSNVTGGVWVSATNLTGGGTVAAWAEATTNAPKLFFRVLDP